MLWTDFYDSVFSGMVSATSINLSAHGLSSQALGDLIGIGNTIAGAIVALALIGYAFTYKDFRDSCDNILGGLVVGLVIIGGWYITGGAMGADWKEYADLADTKPRRVETQSFTFISPMGDTARYLMSPADTSLINFGIMALSGVIVGSLLWSLLCRSSALNGSPPPAISATMPSAPC